MGDTLTELQLEKFSQLNTALDELKSRFLSLAAAGKALQRSFATATTSFLSKQGIAPVFVPKPANQSENAPAGTSGQDGVAYYLLNMVKKAGEELFDVLLGKFIEKGIGKKSPDLSTKTAGPIRFRKAEETAVMPSGTNTGTKTIPGLISAITIAYGIDKLRNNGAGGPATRMLKPNQNVVAQQAPSAIAAMPVFVTNWPASFGMQQAGEGAKGFLDKALDKTIDTVKDALIGAGSEKLMAVLARFSKTLFGTQALGEAAVSTAIATLPVTIPVAAYGVSRMLQEDSKGLVKWRTEHPQDYARQQEMWGIKPVNHLAQLKPAFGMGMFRQQTSTAAFTSGMEEKFGGERPGSLFHDVINDPDRLQNNINLTVNVDGKRVSTSVDHTNTKVSVKRGTFNFGD